MDYYDYPIVISVMFRAIVMKMIFINLTEIWSHIFVCALKKRANFVSIKRQVHL